MPSATTVERTAWVLRKARHARRCALLLATASRKTSAASEVRSGAGPDRSSPGTDGIESYSVKSAAESGDNGLGEGEVLREWRNVGEFSAVLVRISDRWGRSV